MSTEFRIPDARRVRVSDKVLDELSAQPSAVVRAFLVAIEDIARLPPPEPHPRQLLDHPWRQWAAARGLDDSMVGEA